MQVTSLLIQEASCLGMSAQSKDDVISRLVDDLASVRDCDSTQARKDLAVRERKGATIFTCNGHGVAVAHAVTGVCKQLLLTVGVVPTGVAWAPGVEQRAHVIFLLLGPAPTHNLYLKVLSRIRRLCETEGIVDAIVHANALSDIIARLSEAEESLGEINGDAGLPTFCVLGAGHGGMAMAGHLGLLGFSVNLFNRTEERVLAMQARQGIDVSGVVNGFAPLHTVTADPAEAIRGRDILMVVVPATGHRDIAEMIAPHVRDGQVIVLNPGRTGGALEVAGVIRRRNPRVHPYIAEAQTLLYAARMTNPGQVHVYGIKNSVPLATLPAYHSVDVLPVINKAFPQFVPGDNVLKTSLDNIGAVFHPAITILNAARIEDTHGNFEYYVEGVTPAVAAVLEAIDRERMDVARALGIRANTAREWLYLAYDAAGKTLFDAMRANTGYGGIKAPGTVNHRYITEDVPTSLVPIASLGELLGVPTPAMRAMIHLASVMHGIDYWAEGRTVDRLGLTGMSVKDISFLVVGAKAAEEHLSVTAKTETLMKVGA